MKATDFLKRKYLGETNGEATYSKRNWRAFFIALLAGERTVVMNARIEGGTLIASEGGIVANNEFLRL